MSVRYELEGPLLTITVQGEYPPEALFESWEAASLEPGFRDTRSVLLDATQSVSLIHRSRADIRKITNFYLDRAGGNLTRVGLLVSGPLQFGIMRVASTFVWLAGAEARVFRDRDRALSWLREDLDV